MDDRLLSNESAQNVYKSIREELLAT